MPEIGEIQAHAERLADDFVGKTVEKFRPITFYVLKTFSPDPATAHGQKLERVTTRGKYPRVVTRSSFWPCAVAGSGLKVFST